MDSNVQTQETFLCLVSVSSCGQQLKIYNKKVNVEPKYALDTDPKEIARLRQEHNAR